MAPAHKKLGEILIEQGVLDPLQLQSALAHQQQYGARLGRILVERGFCSADNVLKAFSVQTGHPTVDLDAEALDSRLVFTVNVKAAERHRAVPLRLEGKRNEVLVVAMAGPADMQTMDAVLAVSGKSRLKAFLADDLAIDRAIGKLYYGRQPAKPPPPPPQPMNKVEIQGEAEIELSEQHEIPTLTPAPNAAPRAESKTVLLYGWGHHATRVLTQMLGGGGLSARVVTDDEVLDAPASETVIASALSLATLLPPRQKLLAIVIVPGLPNDDDVQQAKAVGANVYLRAPLNPEQLVAAVRKGRG